MVRHSTSQFLLLSLSCLALSSAEYFEEKACEDDPAVKCADFEKDCANETLIPLLRDACPVTCNLCPSTVSPTTLAPCEDQKDTDCASFKDYCSNDKYAPMLKQFCPVTCNMCPGATTVAPPTPNPHCYDSSTKCKEWAANGYCTQTFYSCAERTKYCAKTCGFCTKGACKN